MTRLTITLFLIAVLTSTVVHGQNTPFNYQLVILKPDWKTQVTPTDTISEYKILLDKDLFIDFVFSYDSSWNFFALGLNEMKFIGDFLDYKIIHQNDTMEVHLKYNCDINRYNVINGKYVRNSQMTDTIIFIPDTFTLTQRLSVHDWKQININDFNLMHKGTKTVITVPTATSYTVTTTPSQTDSLNNVKITSEKSIYRVSEKIKLDCNATGENYVISDGRCENYGAVEPLPTIYKKTKDGFVQYTFLNQEDCGPSMVLLSPSYSFSVFIKEPGIYKVSLNGPDNKNIIWYSNEFTVR